MVRVPAYWHCLYRVNNLGCQAEIVMNSTYSNLTQNSSHNVLFELRIKVDVKLTGINVFFFFRIKLIRLV